MTHSKHKMEKVMHEYKEGTLKSGSGKKVKSHKQAIAIALSEARKAGEMPFVKVTINKYKANHEAKKEKRKTR